MFSVSMTASMTASMIESLVRILETLEGSKTKMLSVNGHRRLIPPLVCGIETRASFSHFS